MVPIILLTGFFGAGKTTFVNKLLQYQQPNGQRIALLINEFGKVGIDAHLLSSDTEHVFEVNGGSIFCACTQDQFLEALESIVHGSYDLGIIEATGMAETSAFGEHLHDPGLIGQLEIVENFCLVDAVNFHKVLQTLPAVKNQVQEATTCIINKIDLVSSHQIQELRKEIRLLNPRCVIIESSYGEIDFAKTLHTNHHWVSHQKGKKDPGNLNGITVLLPGTFDKDKLQTALDELSPQLLRAKGLVQIDHKPYYLEFVQETWSFVPYRAGAQENRLVFIGKQLDEQTIWEALFLCLQN